MGAFGSANTFPSLQSGDLRHWVWFKYLVNPPIIGATGPLITYAMSSPPVGANCKIEAVRGAEVFRSGQDITQLYLTITMWWRPGVYASMHLIEENTGMEYNVLSVENVLLLNHILTLNCVAIGNQANLGG